jgi:hypothetical protein
VCEWRVPKEDKTITVNVLKPTDNGSITISFSLRFNAQWSRNINRAIVSFDETQVWSFDYKWDKNVVTDTQNITLEGDIKEWAHVVKVEIIDVWWFSNFKTLYVNIIWKDDQPPMILQDKINVKQTSDGKYNVVMLFEDQSSSIVWWKITVASWNVIDFKGDMAAFPVDSLWTIWVIVIDSFNNVLKQDIDLTKYSTLTQ